LPSAVLGHLSVQVINQLALSGAKSLRAGLRSGEVLS